MLFSLLVVLLLLTSGIGRIIKEKLPTEVELLVSQVSALDLVVRATLESNSSGSWHKKKKQHRAYIWCKRGQVPTSPPDRSSNDKSGSPVDGAVLGVLSWHFLNFVPCWLRKQDVGWDEQAHWVCVQIFAPFLHENKGVASFWSISTILDLLSSNCCLLVAHNQWLHSMCVFYLNSIELRKLTMSLCISVSPSFFLSYNINFIRQAAL